VPLKSFSTYCHYTNQLLLLLYIRNMWKGPWAESWCWCVVGCGGRYHQLLSDCHHCYFQQRLTLLSASVSSAINDLVSRHRRDHCALVGSLLHCYRICHCDASITVTDELGRRWWGVCMVRVQVRSGCAFMIHICEDEHRLFFNFFTSSTPLLKYVVTVTHLLSMTGEGVCPDLFHSCPV